ncbi:PrpR N-terminal domain-containing protein [Eubacterium sp. MSJ-13]|uniref:sigma-54-dependent transcriptional regulator n=1 Tax=Eubacterium sp. MSJ-13 TaxID=2841513 RepID=UPI001C11B4B9|nr:PrpR N-terminal domain-containing protein [Eubacterium sp. MSJ-13]MBU5478654.1 PrpR N-terminal domain-containing protein [Eubacterium sp. MSJ-13]
MLNKIIHILVIAPYTGLANLIKTVAKEFENLQLDIYIGDLENGVKIAHEHLPGNYDAILSRGETARRIQCITPLPVIDISFSEYDILHTLKLAENYTQNFAFVGFKSIIDTVKLLCNLLQYPIKTYTISSEKDIEPTLDILKENEIYLIFSDTATNSLAAEKGIRSISITSGTESIKEALMRIIQLHETFSSFEEKVHLLEKSMGLMSSYTFILDENNQLYFSSYHKTDFSVICQYLQNLPKEDIHEAISKQFHLINDKLFAIHAQKCTYDDTHSYYIFSLDLSPVPNQSSKYGIKYYKYEDVKSNYYTGFFALTTSAIQLSSQIQELNSSHMPVMILGERGTGKDHIAYRLYLESNLTSNPFISIDCNLITERYWAFLTKHINSPFCDNDNTIYINNIQILDESKARQLLSIILDTNLHKRNRLILSCSLSIRENRDPSRDFIDYLPCTTLYMPPLRELTDDLASASSLYLDKLNNDLARQLSGFEPDALALLCRYDWPNNYIQLKRVLSDAAIHTQSGYIQASTIEDILNREKKQYAITAPVRSDNDFNKPLQEIIHDAVLSALNQCNGNHSKAAEQLGIGRTTLWRYLKQ